MPLKHSAILIKNQCLIRKGEIMKHCHRVWCVCARMCVCVYLSVWLFLFKTLFYSSPSNLAQARSGSLVKNVWYSVMHAEIQMKMVSKCTGRITLSRNIMKPMIKYSYFKHFIFSDSLCIGDSSKNTIFKLDNISKSSCWYSLFLRTMSKGNYFISTIIRFLQWAYTTG